MQRIYRIRLEETISLASGIKVLFYTEDVDIEYGASIPSLLYQTQDDVFLA